jgi:hydroxymethylglutaryl-CoA lyase
MSKSVKLIECPRDAWQGLQTQIPTEVKADYLKSLVNAGFKHIDAASFVSPKTVPQMADSEKVLEQLDPPDDVEIIGIVVNEKGADRAIATQAVRTLGFPYSVSETFLKRNQNQTAEENFEALEAIYKKADEAGLDMVVYISMAFGNPYGDPWSIDEVMAAMENISDLGVLSISLADTVGIATPEQIAELSREAVQRFEGFDTGVHLHSRRDDAASRVLAAYDAGIRRFDSAIGGIGGCPFAADRLVGNIPTEVVIEALESRGVGVPVRKSLEELIKATKEIASNYA